MAVPLKVVAHCGRQLTLTVSGFSLTSTGILTVLAKGISHQVPVVRVSEVTITLPVNGVQELMIGYQARDGKKIVAGYEDLRLSERCPASVGQRSLPLRITTTTRNILLQWT